MKIIASLAGLFICLPIWLYLLYKILVAVNATELMWFLYWIYIPCILFTSAVTKLLEQDDK